MSSAPLFKLKYGSTTFELSTVPQTKIRNLIDEIMLLTEVMPSRQEISYGFPTKKIPTDNDSLDLTLESLGIKRRELFTLVKKSINDKSFVHPSSTIVSCEKFEIAADNSCLFASVSYLCTGSISKAGFLRKLCIDKIREDPVKYTETILGQPRDVYCRWLEDPKAWGGYIEMGIMSEYFNVEICVLHIEEGKIVPVNPCVSKKRIYILYNNIHYDAVKFTCFSDPPTRFIVDSDDETALIFAKEMMDTSKTAGVFFNEKKASYKCSNCGKIFTGSAEAEAHANATFHTEMVQIQKF